MLDLIPIATPASNFIPQVIINFFQLCICEHNFLFLGSRLGNSLLLRFQEKCNEVIVLDDSEEPSAKRSKAEQEEDKVRDSLTDCIASDVQDIRDPEEFEVYGNQQETSLQLKSYSFEVSSLFRNQNKALSIYLFYFANIFFMIGL